MKKLLLATLLCSAFVLQTFSSHEEVEDIVNSITASSSLTAEQSQELATKLREYEKDMLERSRKFNRRKRRTVDTRPAGVGEITPELIDIITPYVQINDPLIIGWLCEYTSARGANLELARYIMEKGLVSHTNLVNQYGVPIWHQVLDSHWAPEVLDFLLDSGADLGSVHQII